MSSLLAATASMGELEFTHTSGSSKQAGRIPDAVCTVRAPDDGRKNRLKHAELQRQ
jgi:hypothetical protein